MNTGGDKEIHRGRDRHRRDLHPEAEIELGQVNSKTEPVLCTLATAPATGPARLRAPRQVFDPIGRSHNIGS